MSGRRLITTAEAAAILGISDASVRNWLRQGLLRKTQTGIDSEEVRLLKEKISSGELNRLNRRANKKKSRGMSPMDSRYAGLCSDLLSCSKDIGLIMWLIVLRLLKTHGLVSDCSLERLSKLNPGDFRTSALHEHMRIAFNTLGLKADSGELQKVLSAADAFEFERTEPADKDTAGIIYQSLKQAGEKAVSGSFYTPPEIARELVESAMQACGKAIPRQKFLDPCCGSGQFLLSFIKAGGSAHNIRGIDNDYTAAFTAASNIFIQNPSISFQPEIICADALEPQAGIAGKAESYDIVVTNPPWGAVVSASKDSLAGAYPEVKSGESFSYFISRCLRETRENGIVSLVLPESVTNVGRHADIRNHILGNCRISGIKKRGRIFKGVFTPVITMELQKKQNEPEPAVKNSWKHGLEFNININSTDVRIIDSIYSVPHTNLKGKADWALGIVTGDNERFVSRTPGENLEPVLRGCDIQKGSISEPGLYIRFEPEKFQQTAPLEKYRSPEKLVYRFISKRLVFAKEPDGMLTINSANILIPDLQKLAAAGFASSGIVELFNSDLFSFIHQKRFNSLKVLRSHLEELPLPADPGSLFSRLSASDLQYIGNSVTR